MAWIKCCAQNGHRYGTILMYVHCLMADRVQNISFSMVTLPYAPSCSCKLEIHLGKNCWMCHFSHCLQDHNTKIYIKSIYIYSLFAFCHVNHPVIGYWASLVQNAKCTGLIWIGRSVLPVAKVMRACAFQLVCIPCFSIRSSIWQTLIMILSHKIHLHKKSSPTTNVWQA